MGLLDGLLEDKNMPFFMGLLQAGGPSPVKKSFGQGLGEAFQYHQQSQLMNDKRKQAELETKLKNMQLDEAKQKIADADALRNFNFGSFYLSPEQQAMAANGGPTVAAAGAAGDYAPRFDQKAMYGAMINSQSPTLKKMALEQLVKEPKEAKRYVVAGNLVDDSGKAIYSAPKDEKAPFVKDFVEGDKVVTKQWDAEAKEWKAMGAPGPRFARQIAPIVNVGGGDTSDIVKPPKLKPGERWNSEKGVVESIPGSDLWINQSGKHAKDYDAAKAVIMKSDDAISRVDDILKNPGQIEKNFGGWNAYVSQYLPGEGLAGKNKVDQLKSVLKNAGLEMMRSGGSIGQMTQQEWPIVERMLSNINPSLSEEDALIELGKISAYMRNISNKASDAYETEWGKTQFYKPLKSNAPARIKNNADYDALPSGTEFVDPFGKTRRKP